LIPISELSGLHVEKTSDIVSEGDEFTVKVTKLNEEKEELVVSKKAIDAQIAWEELAKKQENNETIEAEVKDVVKSGLVVDVGLRGFIPASMVERHFVEDFSDYKGRTLTLKVMELDQEKNKVILSHKAVLEEESKASKGKVLDSIEAGNILDGT
ncbi:S1 RNA-binding domain-containing protein, partial [Escherichia coli]|nr:S1 RNA-binding domain-containing protein [Escherichia coli]